MKNYWSDSQLAYIDGASLAAMKPVIAPANQLAIY